MSIELTIVVENTAIDSILASEHGLAVHFVVAGRQFMFDTSATAGALAANAAALAIDLAEVEGVVISHGHPDHTGGIAALLAARPGLKVHASPAAFAERWSARAGQPQRQIGWLISPEALAEQGASFCPVPAARELAAGAVVSGPIPGPQPGIDQFLVKDEGGPVRDEFADELFVMLRGRSGWAVLTGCCHRGLPNTLREARELAGGEPIVTVLGGLHLGPAGPEELAAAAEAIRETNPDVIYPCHCTGSSGRQYLDTRFPGKVRQIHGGTRLEL